MDTILVFDFGGPAASLLGRRVRELGVYSEVVPGGKPVPANTGSGANTVRGIILSGLPEGAQNIPDTASVYSSGLPVLEVGGRPRAGVTVVGAAEIAGEKGAEILSDFVFKRCGCTRGWTMESYVDEICASLVERVGKNPVLLLISGGVDSTVLGALLLKALDPRQVHLMYMDTGLMRKNETKTVRDALERLGAENLHIINCEADFLGALKGLADPEAKRKAIGDLFITVQERETTRLGLPETCFLAQGTIYPDLIESARGGGKGLVKSHHNVGSPLVEAKRKAGRVIEPLQLLYKDEVRGLGKFIGLADDVIGRHPFPGPGLAVRILGEVTREKCDILREADAIFIDELKRRNGKSGKSLYDEIWQAFAVLLPIHSVGVFDGVRRYNRVLALRAINSTDAMTAEVYPFETKDLLEISAAITAGVKEIGRVTYDITGKPPATIEWE